LAIIESSKTKKDLQSKFSLATFYFLLKAIYAAGTFGSSIGGVIGLLNILIEGIIEALLRQALCCHILNGKI